MPRGRGWAGRVATTSDGVTRKSTRQIVREHADALGEDLQRMDRGQDGRRVADLSLLAQDAVLEVAVAAALADARAVAADADRAAHDQVDGTHLARRHWRGRTWPRPAMLADGMRPFGNRCGSSSMKHFSVRRRGTAM